ncbi:MAG: class I SAM-dependent methyltransferase [Bdellovibrio sp.]
MICPLCHFNLNEPRLLNAGVSLFQCSQCYLAFKNSNDFPDQTVERNHYLNHNNSLEDERYLSYLDKSISAVKSEIKFDKSILDYGCGPVKGIEYILKNFNVYSYDPIFYPDHSFKKKKFDLIFINEVAEHFQDPFQEFILLNELLNTNGTIIMRTELLQEKKDWPYSKDPTHVVFYTLKTLDFLCHQFDFELDVFSDKIFLMRKGRRSQLLP